MKIKNYAVLVLFYTMISLLASCEPVTKIEYVEIEVEKEVIVTEFVTETITETVIEEVEVEVIVTEIEYIDREILVEKYIEVDNIIEIITEVEVETIVIEERIVEVERVEYVDNYIEVPVEIVVIEYVDRIETITEYVDRIETVIEYVEVETIVNTETLVTEYVDVEIPVEVIVTEYVDRIETVTEYVDRVETVVEFVEVDNMVYNETIIYIEREVYVVSEPEIIVEPIKEYDNYISTDSKVMGVTQEGFEEIPLIKGLFKIGNVIYFKIDEKFYSQVNNVITEILVADFPEVPASENILFNSGIFKVEKDVYNGQDISKVFKGTSNQARYMIDGACMRGNDLIFSCPSDTGAMLKGVWIWTVNGAPSRLDDLGFGRIW